MPSPPPLTASLRPLIVSAPFGNYVRPAGATATLGTFTLHDRPGRPWRIVKTVRYYPRLKAWVNRIGLRNPGIDSVVRKAEAGKLDVSDKLISIHGFDEQQWLALLARTAGLRPLGIELNLSCPNVGELSWPRGLFAAAVEAAGPAETRVVAKLPPVNYVAMADAAWAAGVRAFHACNTLPVPAGGMSGKPLMPLSLRCVAWLRERFGPEATIIGGGGVTRPDDVDAYADAGADRVAIGTKAMNPMLLVSQRSLAGLLARAAERFSG